MKTAESSEAAARLIWAYNSDEFEKLEDFREEVKDTKKYINNEVEKIVVKEKEKLKEDAIKEIREAREYYSREFREKCWQHDFQRYIGIIFSFIVIIANGLATETFRSDLAAFFFTIGKGLEAVLSMPGNWQETLNIENAVLDGVSWGLLKLVVPFAGVCGFGVLIYRFIRFYFKNFCDDTTLLFQLITSFVVCFLCVPLHLIPGMNVVALYVVVNFIYVAKRWYSGSHAFLSVFGECSTKVKERGDYDE